MKRKIAAGVILLSGVFVAAAAYAGAGDPQPVSAAVAQSRNARTFSQSQCLSNCRSVQKDPSSCAGNCTAGRCYYNPNSGNTYCVN